MLAARASFASDTEGNSVVTRHSFDLDTCRHSKGAAAENYGAWICPGYGGFDVRLGAGDQRMYVTFGDGANLAARQTFPGLNDVYKGRIEWRLGRGDVCHAGYVDARANADANELARRMADKTARSFRCGVDKPAVAGAVTPGLAMPH
jgi:hypothetical protein